MSAIGREAKALGKAVLPAGTSKTMTLTVPCELLMFTNAKMQKCPEAGWFTVMAGIVSTRIYVK